jgi:uncharacterized Zn-binding protein involved in type VI secretion
MAGPAARLTDMHTCPLVTGPVPHVGGPITAPGCPTVLIGGLPAARVTDMAVCVGPPDAIILGSPTVLIGGMPAARIGDMTSHGGVIVLGCPTVIIGEVGMGSPGAPAAGGSAGSTADESGEGTFSGNVDASQIAAAKKEAARSGIPFCEECTKD